MNDVDGLSVSQADVRAAKASGYLQQLCKHFGHKVPVSFNAMRGRIEFQGGVCELNAAEPGVLKIRLAAASTEERARLENVVGRHLLGFAFREEIDVRWQVV